MAAQVGVAPIKQRGVATLGGTEKVAALLLAMGRQAAASVLAQFEPQDIRIVTKAAAELRPITAQELESIVEEFAQQFSMGANTLDTQSALEAWTGDLPVQGASADRRADPVQGQAGLRRQGHEPVALQPAQRIDAARAQPQADR